METIDRRTFAGAIASGVVMNSSALAGQEFEEKKMVWGMREPGSFGDYFPDGDCVGWDEKLSWYYANEMSDAEKTEMEMQDRILYSKFAAKFFRDHGPIKPHEWPDEWQAEKTYNNLGSLVKLAGGPIVVDEALKNLIERLEPGVHQFSPIKITMPKGQEYPKQYYAFVISQFRDSFSPEDSDEGSWRDESFDAYWGERIAQYYVNIPQKKYFEGLAMRREVFGSSHIWRESKLQTPEIFLSDTLNAEIINAGLRVPKTFQLKEA